MSDLAICANIESGYAEAMARHYSDLEKNRSEVMSQVAELVSPRKLASIKEFIDDADGGSFAHSFELTDSHSGTKQDEPGTAFRYVYIDQRSSGCPAGDDYYGDVWIPLPKGKYLKFSY